MGNSIYWREDVAITSAAFFVSHETAPGAASETNRRASKHGDLRRGDHRHAVERHFLQIHSGYPKRRARGRAHQSQFRDGVRRERAAVDRRDRQVAALPAAYHRDAPGYHGLSYDRQHRRPAERDHRSGRDHRRQGHHAGIQCRPATGAGDRPERPRALSHPSRQRRGPPVHQQAGHRPRQQAMVGPVHAALPQPRRQVRRRRRHLAEPGASDRLLQPDRFRLLNLHRPDRTGRRGSFERRQQRRIPARARARRHQDVSERANRRQRDIRGYRPHDRRRPAGHVPAGSRASARGQRQHGPQ